MTKAARARIGGAGKLRAWLAVEALERARALEEMSRSAQSAKASRLSIGASVAHLDR